MKKFTLALAAFAILVANCPAQDTKTASHPTPTPVDEGVVKISTNLIQVDVTVTDGNGKVITDLKPGDIEIFENGKKQQITNFSFVSSGRTVVDGRVSPTKNADKLPVPQIPSVAPTQNSVRRTIAIVVD